jgi:hypothetical protein
MNRAFSAGGLVFDRIPGALPQADYESRAYSASRKSEVNLPNDRSHEAGYCKL